MIMREFGEADILTNAEQKWYRKLQNTDSRGELTSLCSATVDDGPITQLRPRRREAEVWGKWNTVGNSGKGKKYIKETGRSRFTVVLKRCGNKTGEAGNFLWLFKCCLCHKINCAHLK